MSYEKRKAMVKTVAPVETTGTSEMSMATGSGFAGIYQDDIFARR